ncbi:MAG: hypothetical protein QNL04_01570 [SAR324 cluster bacterium]|nr:hypothetical protein [SAR324 cluster bacterium]
MTMQDPDYVFFKGKRWEINDASSSLDDAVPSNEDLGIETVMENTANWSGRVDTYCVADDHLYLLKSNVTLTDEFQDWAKYIDPKWGVEVIKRYEPYTGSGEVTPKNKFGRWINEEGGSHLGYWVYTDFSFVFPDKRLKFTGQLDIETYPSLDPWTWPFMCDDSGEKPYESVRLTFEDGKLC